MTSRLPYALQKRGSMLLHQQCWLWGRDICRKEGNLLLEMGFERVRPPRGTEGSSQYMMKLGGSLHVRLWGFGIYYGSEDGVYLNRYAFTPLRASVTGDVWTPKSFSRLSISVDFHTVADVVGWMASIEESVLQRLGTAYRAQCLLGWSKRALQPLDHLLALRTFARDVDEFAERQVLLSDEFSRTRRTYSTPFRSRSSCDEDGTGTQFLKHPGITQLGTPLFQAPHRIPVLREDSEVNGVIIATLQKCLGI